MNLNDHLFYIDITNQCRLDCNFCMYKTERSQKPKNLKLNEKAERNLSNLINEIETDHIIISGEGEPINNLETIYNILKLSKGKNNFQIISNGEWVFSRGENILNTLNQLAEKNNDKYLIRLSFDSQHYSKIGIKNYLSFFKLATSNNSKNIGFALRSVKEDQNFVLEKLGELLPRIGLEYYIKSESIIDDAILFSNKRISINYKNLISPKNIAQENIFSIWDYMKAIGEKYGKAFTLGNLKTKSEGVGLDVTIKPGGDVFFYGAENGSQGNIFKNKINVSYLKKRIEQSKLFTALYSKPLIPILKKLSENSNLKFSIERINNPYWIIKELYSNNKDKFDEVLGLK